MKKEVQKSIQGKNLNLFIVEQLKSGSRPSKIAEVLGIKMNALSYHLSLLKKAKIIERVGYGSWNVLKDFDEKEVQKSSRVGLIKPDKFEVLKPNSVRGHGFQFTLQIPEGLRNWERRRELFVIPNITWQPLNHIFGGGEKIILKGRIVHLTNKSIIIYEKESFIAEKASESQSHAISHFLSLIKALERHLKADFSSFGKYRFKVTRQHYSLIKNALARQYDDENRKLYCYAERGLWLLIDNSFNLHETETVHPESAVKDNEKVQDFFNGLDKMEKGFTPQFVVNAIANNARNLDQYAVHLKSHIESVQKLGNAVEELTKVVKDLKGGNHEGN